MLRNTGYHFPPGDVSIGIKCAPGVVGPAEADIDFDIIKNDNDTFTVKYTPPGPGQYTIMVLFADQVREATRASTLKCTHMFKLNHKQSSPSMCKTGNPHQPLQNKGGAVP